MQDAADGVAFYLLHLQPIISYFMRIVLHGTSENIEFGFRE